MKLELDPDLKLLVREVPGPKVQHLIGNSTAFNKTDDCSRPGCWPCRSTSTGSKGAYKVECTDCLRDGVVGQYIGESGYTAHTRAGLHQRGLQAEDPQSALWEHSARLHGAREGEGRQYVDSYKMTVTGSYKSSSRRRSIN